jgi:hypothetical protein
MNSYIPPTELSTNTWFNNGDDYRWKFFDVMKHSSFFTFGYFTFDFFFCVWNTKEHFSTVRKRFDYHDFMVT